MVSDITSEAPQFNEIIDYCILHIDDQLTRHNDFKHFIHRICFLADSGFTSENPGIEKIAKSIMSRQDDRGVYLCTENIPKAFRGPGIVEKGWILCDFPLQLYYLIKTGYRGTQSVEKAIAYLINLGEDCGWNCKGYYEGFRGPGKPSDHCPLATLYSLKVFAMLPEYHSEKCVVGGIDSLLYQWNHSYDGRIYMFGMGKRFRKLKYPNHWFDVLHVADVLSRFRYACNLDSFKEMIRFIESKKQDSGGFIPESIYMLYRGWDFGQKREVSPTLTAFIDSMLARISKNTH